MAYRRRLKTTMQQDIAEALKDGFEENYVRTEVVGEEIHVWVTYSDQPIRVTKNYRNWVLFPAGISSEVQYWVGLDVAAVHQLRWEKQFGPMSARY